MTPSSAGHFQRIILQGDSPGPTLLITGGVHGDEFEPITAIRRLSDRITRDGLAGTLQLVPLVNEPAFLIGQRCAEDGLDLARTCPGGPTGSITQQIAHELSAMIRETDFYIDLHTGGRTMMVQPLTGYMLHADGGVLDRQRAMARAFSLPLVWGTTPRLEGRSLSVARDASVPAIYAEYEGGGRFSEAGVRAYVDGCLNVMALLGMIPPRETVPSNIEVVEDAREGSGHMQVQHPSPHAGVFEPAVELGQHVRACDPLGTVFDPQTGVSTAVPTAQTGRIIVLRTWPQVVAGDALAVILEPRPPGDQA